jgi:type II secretory pathway pseudopilin PulG
MRKQSGFTTIELIIAVLFLCVIGALFMVQKNEADALNRDTLRKTAINAMYYDLEQVYFPAQKSYPRVLDSATLAAIDPSLLKDPEGIKIGKQESDYRYEPSGCNGDACTGYTLRAKLEKEKDFIKQNS